MIHVKQKYLAVQKLTTIWSYSGSVCVFTVYVKKQTNEFNCTVVFKGQREANVGLGKPRWVAKNIHVGESYFSILKINKIV